MKIDEYIKVLQELQSIHGVLDVDSYQVDGSRMTASAPGIKYRKKLRGREHVPRFFMEGIDSEEQRGEKVIYV